MAYFPVHSLGVTEEQKEILLDVPKDELRKMSTYERFDVALRHREAVAAESSAKWDALASFATAIIPLAAFLGISALFKVGGK